MNEESVMLASLQKVLESIIDWKKEIDSYIVDSSGWGVAQIYPRIDRLTGHLDRLDGIRCDFLFLRAKVLRAQKSIQNSYDDRLDEVRVKDTSSLVAKGMSSDERLVFCRNSTSLLDLRIRLRQFEETLLLIEAFRIIIEGRISLLSKAKYDCVSVLTVQSKVGYSGE